MSYPLFINLLQKFFGSFGKGKVKIKRMPLSAGRMEVPFGAAPIARFQALASRDFHKLPALRAFRPLGSSFPIDIDPPVKIQKKIFCPMLRPRKICRPSVLNYQNPAGVRSEVSEFLLFFKSAGPDPYCQPVDFKFETYFPARHRSTGVLTQPLKLLSDFVRGNSDKPKFFKQFFKMREISDFKLFPHPTSYF